MKTELNANSPLDIGNAICSLNELINSHELSRDDFKECLDICTRKMHLWLMHPVGRNWELVRDLSNIYNYYSNRKGR